MAGSDMGEDFAAMREMSQVKRAGNRDSSLSLLQAKGFEVQVKNAGAHIIVGAYDFWPGTGLFISRRNQKRGRGVFNLIRNLEKEASNEAVYWH